MTDYLKLDTISAEIQNNGSITSETQSQSMNHATSVSETTTISTFPSTTSTDTITIAPFSSPTALTDTITISTFTSATTSNISTKTVFSDNKEISLLSNDVGLWPQVLTNSNIDYCIKMKAAAYQNCDIDLFDRKSIKQIDGASTNIFERKCHIGFFERKAKNGETVKRSWLCFSPSTGRVFCYICKLFPQTSTQFRDGGFCDWKNAAARLISHETAKHHLNAIFDYSMRSKEVGRVDQRMIQLAEDEAKYWREVLRRLISVIIFISERGLAFRGDNETLGSPNNGNYLGILELIAQYDDFLSNHIKKHANRGSGHTNYLSSSICEEILELIGKRVFNEVISRIKKSKYYSISLDSTPDEGHVDQLTLIFRYLENHIPVERFLTFMPNQGHKAKDMFQALKTFLKDNNIDINDCRGQSYDNASSMSGKYNGLQALVLAENNLAVWIPCAGHSLNLVLQNAAECCLSAVNFFYFLEELFVYFTASTGRYKVLTDCLNKSSSDKPLLVPKRISTTRWSCRADATSALLRGYEEIKNALFEISQDTEDTGKSRATAQGLFKKMSNLETGLYTVFWDDILDRVNKTSKILQNPRLDVNTAASALISLKSFIETKRDSFEDYKSKAVNLTSCNDYRGEAQRQRKTNVRLSTLDCPQAIEATLTPAQKFRIESFLPIIDQFQSSLQQRLEAYKLIDDRFGFLNKLGMLTNADIAVKAENLVKIYNNDLEEHLINELIQFKTFSQQYKNEIFEDISEEMLMYQLILEKGVNDCFPNVEITLRIYLSLMVTNSSGERSFSKLKLIKNRLRTSMLEDRLNFLTLLSIESDLLKSINVDEIIKKFIANKNRRKAIMS